MRTCPVSGETLEHTELHGVQADVGAYGVWLDKGEFYLITEKQRHAEPGWMFSDLFRRPERPHADPSRVIQCPVCSVDMEVENLHGVHVDWCREHGIWLDSGELEAIQNNLRLDPLFVGKIATRLWETRF